MSQVKIIGDKDQYELMEKLGEGAFAAVYKARSLSNKKLFAIKKMKKMNKQLAEMVANEIQIMEGLKHKNIVEYFTNFRWKGEWYIVLEYCGKGNMEEYKKKVGKIPEYHCKLFVKCILEALIFLHDEKKIAHRDLKLQNILITDNYQLKLADFGFSKDYNAGYFISFCGSLLFMAPEILKREKYSLKCDVWSLGVLTFMMLYNRPPYFPTKSDNHGIEGVINAVTRRKHKFDENVKVSDSGKDFINLCLEKISDKRPSTTDLKNHPWLREDIDLTRTSFLREKAFSESLSNEFSLAKGICKEMAFGVIEEHIKKITDGMLLSVNKIKNIVKILKSQYLSSPQILLYYLTLVGIKLEALTKRQIILVYEDQTSYHFDIIKIKKFMDYLKQASTYINSEVSQINYQKPQKIKIQKEIIKFILSETELLMDNNNEAEISQKLSFLKNLNSFVLKDYENSMVNVHWGCNSDYEKEFVTINNILNSTSEAKLIDIINEQVTNDNDLESIWLIEHQLKEAQNPEKKKTENDLGKLIECILNIPSNFTIDKYQQTQKMDLAENLMD